MWCNSHKQKIQQAVNQLIGFLSGGMDGKATQTT